MNVHVTLNRL